MALFLDKSSGNRFVSNRASSRTSIGIALDNSNSTQFTGQTVAGAVYGIYIGHSNGNTFQNCGTVTGGVYMSADSVNNVFTSCPY
jgi:parallel beta-helix repeat protein